MAHQVYITVNSYQLHELQKEKWLLKDEVAHLQCERFREDPLLKHIENQTTSRFSGKETTNGILIGNFICLAAGSKLPPSASRTSSPEQEQVRDVPKGKSVVSLFTHE